MPCPTHIIDEPRSPCSDGLDVWAMLCGAQCLSFPDGSLSPDGFDFFNVADGHRADCQPCKDVLRARQVHRVAKNLLPVC